MSRRRRPTAHVAVRNFTTPPAQARSADASCTACGDVGWIGNCDYPEFNPATGRGERTRTWNSCHYCNPDGQS